MQTNLHINKKFEILKNKKEKIAFKTSPRKQINNLDSLPHYDRSLVDYEKYHQYIGIIFLNFKTSLFCHKILIELTIIPSIFFVNKYNMIFIM